MRAAAFIFAAIAALSAAFAASLGSGSGGVLAPVSCAISPSSVSAPVATTVQLWISCSDSAGESVQCPPMQWSSTIGSIHAPAPTQEPSVPKGDAAFFTGTAAGSGTITASSASPADPQVSCSIPATVRPGQPSRVSVLPKEASAYVGSQQQFVARLYDTYGNEISSSSFADAFSWSVESDVKIGEIAQSGLFLATAPGSGAVVAAYGGSPDGTALVGSSRITVMPSSIPAYCVISPQGAKIAVKSQQQFSVKCYQEDPRAAKAAAIETICPQMLWSASDGSIKAERSPSPAGQQQAATFYSGTLAHKVSITAYEDSPAACPACGLHCLAEVEVLPGPASSAAILPALASLYVGDSQQFMAIASDAYGNPIQGASFRWSASGGVGSVDSSGKFTAASAGSGTVKAELATTGAAPGISASAQVEVRASPSGGSGGTGGSNSGGGSFSSSSTLSYTCAGAPATLKVLIFVPGSQALAEMFYLGNQTVKVFSANFSSNQENSVPLAKSGDYELRISVGTDQRTVDFYVPPCTPANSNATKNITIELKEPPAPKNATRNLAGGSTQPKQQGEAQAQQEGGWLAAIAYAAAFAIVLAAAAFIIKGKKK